MSETFERRARRPWWPVAAALAVVIAGVGLVALAPGERGTEGDVGGLPVEADQRDEDGRSEGHAQDAAAPGAGPIDEPEPFEEGPPDGRGPPDAEAGSQPTLDEVDALPGGPALLLYALTDDNSVVEFDLGTGERRESAQVHFHPNRDPSRIWITDDLVLLHDPSRGHLYGRARDFGGGPFRLDEPLEGRVRTVLSSPDGTAAWAVIGEHPPHTDGEQEVRPIEADRLGEPVAEVASPFDVFGAVEGGFVLDGPGGAAYLADGGGDMQDWRGLSTVDHRRGVVLLRRCSAGHGCELWRSRGPRPEPVALDEEQAPALTARVGLNAAVSPDGTRAALHGPGTKVDDALPVTVVDLDNGQALASIEVTVDIARRGLRWSPDGSWLIAIDPVRRGSVRAWAPDDGRHVSLHIADSLLRHVEIVER